MPVDPQLLISAAKTHLTLNYTCLITFLDCKLLNDRNPSSEEDMVADNDLNKRLVGLMEEIRDDDFFAQLTVRGSSEQFLMGWSFLEDYRRHWELPYYEKYDDAQWQQQLTDLQEIMDAIGGATVE